MRHAVPIKARKKADKFPDTTNLSAYPSSMRGSQIRLFSFYMTWQKYYEKISPSVFGWELLSHGLIKQNALHLLSIVPFFFVEGEEKNAMGQA